MHLERLSCSRTPWETVFLSDDDIDVVWGKWVSLFEMTVQAVIPTKRLKRRNHLPWVNREIRKQIRRKRHLSLESGKGQGNTISMDKIQETQKLVEV